MLLQLALDCLEEKHTLDIINKTQKHIDIIEIGTPLIKYQGINMLRKIRKEFPKHKILVDLKTMDAGEYEATPFFAEGADFVTVLGVADKATILGVVKAAEGHKGKVIIDLIAIPNKVARIKELDDMKSHYFSIHTGIDQQHNGQTPLSDLKKVKEATTASISVAGGINLDTVEAIAGLGPQIIVVGGAITGSKDPENVAKKIKACMNDKQVALSSIR
jgi:3-hexulose-6-phosphate synthase